MVLASEHISYRQFAWPFISRQTHFMLLFSMSFSAKHTNHATLSGGEVTLLCVCTSTCQVRAAFLLMWSQVSEDASSKPADRWPTRPWIACNISASIPTGVSDCCGAPQESHLLTNHCDQWFFFSKWQNWKEMELTFKAGEWINSNQSSRLTEQNP